MFPSLFNTLFRLLLLAHTALAQGDGDKIILMEPIGNVKEIPVTNNEGLGVLGYYIGLLYPWMVGMAAGTCVLMAAYGGLEIIQAGADTGQRDAGKNRLLVSLGGLLLILGSSTLLNTFNPTFFR